MAYKFKVGDIITLTKKQNRGLEYQHSMDHGGPYWRVFEVPVPLYKSYFRCISIKQRGLPPFLFYAEEIQLTDLSDLEKVVYNVKD